MKIWKRFGISWGIRKKPILYNIWIRKSFDSILYNIWIRISFGFENVSPKAPYILLISANNGQKFSFKSAKKSLKISGLKFNYYN